MGEILITDVWSKIWNGFFMYGDEKDWSFVLEKKTP